MTPDIAGLGHRDMATVRALPLFKRLSDRAFHTILGNAVVRHVERDTVIFVQDEPADRFFVLLGGWVKLYRITRDGAESVVAVVAPGESFAEASLFGGDSFPVCAQAVSATRILALTAGAFRRSIEEDTDAAFAMMSSLSLRLRFLVQQIEQLQIRHAPQRVGGFLLHFCPPGPGSATVQLPFEKALAAKRLGMQPETFSRALAKLRGLGVETHGASIAIADMDALRKFCEDSESVQGDFL